VGPGDTEDGGVCGIPVWLLLPGRLWLGEDGALPRLDPRLLHFLPTLYVTDGADRQQTPGWLGFEGAAPSGAFIAGGRWDGRCDRTPVAWRHSVAAGSATRPSLSTAVARVVRGEEEKGRK
jgi:hypothetical protein